MGGQKNNRPSEYHEYSGELDSLLLAARTASLQPACRLLLVHQGDLAWSQNPGSFLFRIALGDEVGDAIEMTVARTAVGAVTFIRSLWPALSSMMAELASDDAQTLDLNSKEAEDEWLMKGIRAGINLARKAPKESTTVAGINFLELLPALLNGLSSWLARAAMALHRRQLAALGMSAHEYEEMVRCLLRLGGYCVAIARVAFPANSLHPELEFSGQGGFHATRFVSGCRLNSSSEAQIEPCQFSLQSLSINT